ncbi:11801_t:CDS:2 [Entrophospora sp. SA101]|nr:11801_t:CDS:2 [Entrophospora sp. SA101]
MRVVLISVEQLNQNNEPQSFSKGKFISIDNDIKSCKYDYLYNDEWHSISTHNNLTSKHQ